jgi:hypothetical protein
MTNQTFTGTGSQLAFALNTTPAVSNITVYVDGVQLTQTTNSPGDFVLSGYNVVFNVAPAHGSVVSVSYLANDPGTTGSFFNGVGVLTASMYVNERGGVWQINIVDNIVSLTFVQEILPNNRVRIIAGKTYGGSVVYYNSNYAVNQGVPNYLIYNPQQTSYKNKTTFNGGSTRFFSYRDQYYTPGTQDKYIKFPQFGAFE